MLVRHTRGGGNGTARWTYLMAAVRAGAGGGLMGSFTHSFTEQALQSLVLGPGKGTELTRSFPLLYGISSLFSRNGMGEISLDVKDTRKLHVKFQPSLWKLVMQVPPTNSTYQIGALRVRPPLSEGPETKAAGSWGCVRRGAMLC